MKLKKDKLPSRNMSVRGFITLLIIAGSITLVLLTQLSNGYLLNVSLIESAKSEISSTAQQAANTIEEWVEKQTSIASSIKNTLEFFGNLSDKEIEDYLAVRLTENPDALMYYFANASDKILCANHSDISGQVDIDSTEYWQKAVKNNTTIFTEPYTDSVTGKLLITMSCPISFRNETYILIADITIERLDTLIETLMTGTELKAFLINENGTVMSHYDSSLEPQQSGNTNLTKVLNIDLSSETTELITDTDGKEQFLALGHISSSGWTVGLLKERELIIKMIRHYSNINMLVALIFLVVALPVVSIILKKKLSVLSEISSAMTRLENGDLTVKIDKTTRKDDVGGLQNAAAGLTANLTKLLTQLTATLSEIAEGNLKLDDIPDYKGDFIKLSSAVNQIKNTLARVIREVSEAASYVGNGSNELSDATTSLAQGITEQAASMQNIETRLGDIADQINTSSDNCSVIEAKLHDFDVLVQDGNENMKLLMDNVSEVERMSADIQKIVEAIDNIAFQTNILSLNASVEAARAGEQGRGFAVVAEEVRNLASKSADESSKTDELVRQCISAITTAKKYADKTMENFRNIVKDSQEITNAFTNIAEATSSQNTGASIIKGEVESVSTVIQTTSATTEETAASTVELSQQAESLNKLIRRFRF